MITAATVSSRRVCAIRLRRRSASSAPSARTSGIMLTPVSNPDSPRTRSGKARNAVSSALPTPPVPSRASSQFCSTTGSPKLRTRPATTTTAFSARNTTTSGTATLTASLNPARNTPPSTASRPTVTST